MDAPLGLEPRLMESKSTFLPLEDPPKYWYSVTGSNRRHPGCKPDTLPTELTEQKNKIVVCTICCVSPSGV